MQNVKFKFNQRKPDKIRCLNFLHPSQTLLLRPERSSEVDLVSLQDLVCLFQIYLTPLQTETFLSKDEVNAEKPFRLVLPPLTPPSLPQMEALFGSLPDMLDFQRVFLQTLEDRIASCPNFSRLETPGQFKVRSGSRFPSFFSACF